MKANVQHKKGMKKIGISSKNPTDVYINLAKDIDAGKQVPLIKIRNVGNFIKEMKKRGIPEETRKEILSAILFNNKKRLTQLKNKNTDEKISVNKQKILQKSLRHNADSFVFVPKYSDAQVQAQKNKWLKAIKATQTAQGNLDNGEKTYVKVENEFSHCKKSKFCAVKNRKSAFNKKLSIYTNRNAWVTTILPNFRKALAAAKAAEKAEHLKYTSMLAENKDEKAMQQAQWEEERKRQEELRKQEQHEAELRQEGIEENVLELELAKQAAEIQKTQKETENIGKETEKTFGVSASGVTSEKFDTKTMIYGIGGAAVLISIALLLSRRH